MQKRPKPVRSAIIGETIQVTRANNKSLIGIHGKAIDETKNTITVMTDKGNKKLVKENITIKINDEEIIGEKLSGRIEARIKQQ